MNASEQQAGKGRIEGYDFARAMAILGMMIVHFTLVMSLENWGSGWLSGFVEFFDGRAAATFVVLAGVGLTLRSRGAVRSNDGQAMTKVRTTLARRGVFLLAAGFINLVIWPGDILRVYGFSFLLALWFIKARDRWLWTVALSFVFVFVLLIFFVDYEENWEWDTLTYHNLWTASGVVRNLFYDGFRTVFPWTGLLFVGMWLGRRDMHSPRVRRKVLLWGCGITVFTEVISRMLVGYFLAHPHGMDEETVIALFGVKSMPPLPLFLLSAGGAAMAVIALSIMVTDRFSNRLWVRAVVASGQMAFTWYIAHIVLGLGAVILLGLVLTRPMISGVAAALVFFVLTAAASMLWKRFLRHGPIEWLMRRLTG